MRYQTLITDPQGERDHLAYDGPDTEEAERAKSEAEEKGLSARIQTVDVS